MRILVNGYFYGGNCPPFFYYLKKYNNDIKISNALGAINEYGVNYDYLSDDDIIRLDSSPATNLILKLLKKLRIPIWRHILQRKVNRLVKNFRPDIIINHKASINAKLMLNTGFTPQVTYIYGGEVHGDRIRDKVVKQVFEQSCLIVTTTQKMRNYVLNSFPDLTNKINVFPFGYFDMQKMLQMKNTYNKNELRERYGFKTEDIVFFETRSLRGHHAGLKQLLDAVEDLSRRQKNFKLVILRGFLGTDEMVGYLSNRIDDNKNLCNHVILLDDILVQDMIFEYYLLSDAFISILPDDQFGTSILDAIFSDCSLILSDLQQYKDYLGETGPLYVQNQNVNQLTEHMSSIIENKEMGRLTNQRYDNLIVLMNPENNFKNLYTQLQKIAYQETGSH